MRILISAGIYPPDIGGPATYVRELQEKLPDKGVDIDVVAYSDFESGYDEEYDAYRINRDQNVLSRYWNYFKQAYKLAKEVDLIYVQGPGAPALPSYFASRLTRTPYIMKIVGDYAWEQSRQSFGVDDLLDEFQEKKYSWKVEFFRKLQSFLVKGAEKVITPSYYLKSIVKKWEIESGNISVVYNDVSVDTIDKSRKEIKKELDYSDDDKFTLLCVARFVPWKGFYKLIDAVRELNQEGEDVQLLLIGDGTIFNEVKNYVDKNEIDNVKLLGRRPHEEVLRYMKVVGAFILNTGYEGLPHVLIEAMYNKLPVLTTPAGGNTELIEDNERGLLFSYNNKKEIKEAISKLSENKELQNKLAEKGYEFVKELEKEDMIENLLKVFNNKFKKNNKIFMSQKSGQVSAEKRLALRKKIKDKSIFNDSKTESILNQHFSSIPSSVSILSKEFNFNNKKVLDIGSAYGQTLFYWGEGSEGVETQEDLVKFVKKMGYNVYPLNVEDGFHSIEKKFEAIHTNNLIEHLVAPHLFLARLHSLLKSDGLLAIGHPVVPPVFLKSFWNFIDYNGWLASEHINFFTPKTIRFFLERSGFKIKSQYFRGLGKIHPLLGKIGVPFGNSILSVCKKKEDYKYADKRIKEFDPSWGGDLSHFR